MVVTLHHDRPSKKVIARETHNKPLWVGHGGETCKVLQLQDPVVGARSVGSWTRRDLLRIIKSSVEKRKRVLDEGDESRTSDSSRYFACGANGACWLRVLMQVGWYVKLQT